MMDDGVGFRISQGLGLDVVSGLRLGITERGRGSRKESARAICIETSTMRRAAHPSGCAKCGAGSAPPSRDLSLFLSLSLCPAQAFEEEVRSEK